MEGETCVAHFPMPLISVYVAAMQHQLDRLTLEVCDLEVHVLTGIYSEETHLPQPLRISLRVDLDCPEHFSPDTPLSESKNYMDLKHAATNFPAGQHYVLIEAVADDIADTLFTQDKSVQRVEVKIVKLAIAEADESIGITMIRHRR
jgi:7,8-dihydroneopterin aldolase/epimerase/oxygenase